MADYGAKGSTQGFNVRDVADQLLSFSSSFPTPGIVATDTKTSSGILTHNLGYYPMILSFFTTGSSPEITTMTNDWQAGIGTDNVSIVVDVDIPRRRTYVTNINLEDNFTASNRPGDETGGAEEDFFIKITKEGKDVSSTDLRDFVVDTTTRSPLVHKIKSGTMTTDPTMPTRWAASLDSGLSYQPFSFCFAKAATETVYRPCPRPVGATFIPFFDVQGSVTTVYAWKDDYPTAPKYSIVLLKNKAW